MSFIKNHLTRGKKKGASEAVEDSFDSSSRSPYFNDSPGMINRGVRLDWMYVPPGNVIRANRDKDPMDYLKSSRFELRILNLPPLKPVAPGTNRTVKLDLRVTGMKCQSWDDWNKVDNRVVLSTNELELRGPQGMEEPVGYWPASNTRRFYIVIEKLRVPFGLLNHTYYIEGHLQIEGLDFELFPMPFPVWCNPVTGSPLPLDDRIYEFGKSKPPEEAGSADDTLCRGPTVYGEIQKRHLTTNIIPFIKKLLTRWKKETVTSVLEKYNPLYRSAYFNDYSGMSNGKVKLDWMYIPPERSAHANCDGDARSMHLELRILNLPSLELLPRGVSRTARLDLRVTGKKCQVIDDWHEVPNTLILQPENWKLQSPDEMEAPAGHWPALKNPNTRRCYIVIPKFNIDHAMLDHVYFVEGKLRIQGHNRELLLRPFMVWYNPQTGRPEPVSFGVYEFGKSEPEEEEESIDATLQRVVAAFLKADKTKSGSKQ